MKKPRYDDKFRSNAVVLLEAAGYPDQLGALKRTAAHLGVHPWTLRRWATEAQNPAPREVVTEKKGDLARLFRKEIEAAIGEMHKARPDASYRDLGTVIGILTDKLQLITGEPTENSNTRIVIEYADLAPDSAETASLARPGGAGGEAL